MSSINLDLCNLLNDAAGIIRRFPGHDTRA